MVLASIVPLRVEGLSAFSHVFFWQFELEDREFGASGLLVPTLKPETTTPLTLTRRRDLTSNPEPHNPKTLQC